MSTSSSFVQYLATLANASVPPSGGDPFRLFEEWNRVGTTSEVRSVTKIATTLAAQDEAIDDEDAWQTLLDTYSVSGDGPESSTVLQELASIPTIPLSHLRALLASSRSDVDISTDLAEAIGFDRLELVAKVLEKRGEISAGLDSALINGHETPEGKKHHGSTSMIDYEPLKAKGKQKRDFGSSLDEDAARRRMEEAFRANAARPLFTEAATPQAEVLPHVYTSMLFSQGNVISHLGSRYMLPLGTTRTMHEEYEEVIVPPARPVPPRETESLVPVSELDELTKGSFSGYSSLNRIQSIVYPTAYRTNENMLICAPTGAGKTDVAMLTILRVIDQHRSRNDTTVPLPATINRNSFKIIYVAPMKALAAEIVRKLGKRLRWLSIKVRELTGDMQLTKAEIAETQIIVTTPEKWDVVTRKPTGEGELVSRMRLLIIDEVHLLNEERGAVIETIVARTLRQVESSQSLIRLVGLSATLPNYIDVADFLRVSRQHGLFYFDSSFRPIPLEQRFLGIKGKQGSTQARKNLDRVTYEKVSELVQEGHQVMVFVHARKETVKSALALKEAALTEGTIDDFSCEDHPQWGVFKREIGTSKNKELKELFNYGFGTHHAGMLRADRNLVERLFEAKAIKVLCCTATLAWGVNLPAHAVLIKGTQVYDSSQGKFVDLSILDVLQIFGRAGRPGLETSGVGYICTAEEMLTHYLDAVMTQNPIESKFVGGMVDSLNAEIALGTVSSVSDAVQWIGYTYLFVRMRKNPFIYGMLHDEVVDDPQLGNKRHQLVIAKAKQLAAARMINYDEQRGTFTITDLGRIAAKFYIRSASIEIFNQNFRSRMSEADVLAILSKSTEFDQIQLRENEVDELKSYMENEDIVPYDVRGGTDTSQGKVNILLQTYVSRVSPEDFALVSDMLYAAQNGGRIIRALLEIALSRKWAEASAVLMALSKAVEMRLWPFQHPLSQYQHELHKEVLFNLQRWADDLSVAELAEKTGPELGQLIHMNDRHGNALSKVAKQFPTVTMTYDLRPLTSDLLKISVHVTRSFDWGSRSENSVEPFLLWIEESEGLEILQLSHSIFRKTTTYVDIEFIISYSDSISLPSVTIRFISDRWLGAEDEIQVPLDHLLMPVPVPSTKLLPLPLISLEILSDASIRNKISPTISNFNTIQTTVFWWLCSTEQNTLLCAPVGSGKSMMGHITLLQTLRQQQEGDGWTLLISPQRSLLNEAYSQVSFLSRQSGITVERISSQIGAPSGKGKSIRLIGPGALLSCLMDSTWKRSLQNLRLVVCENLELLDAEYEVAVSLLLHATQKLPVRFVGLSASLSDATDMAAWLRVQPQALHNFKPSDRDQDLTTTIQPFTIPHSAALYKSMAKPAHAAIHTGNSAIIFASSRAQCRTISADLITQCAINLEMQGFLPQNMSADDLGSYLDRLQDLTLADALTRGIGIWHDGLTRSDRFLVLELYSKGALRVLVVPRDSCWSLPVHASVVIVMGTQYVRLDETSTDRQLKDYPLMELMHMQSRSIVHGSSGRFYLFCQAEEKEILNRFLSEGLPLESSLYNSNKMKLWFRDRKKDGFISDVHQAMDILSWTYLSRRLAKNPMYYTTAPSSVDEHLSRYIDSYWGEQEQIQ